MAKGPDEMLMGLLSDPGLAAAQADLTQAVALSRQTLLLRQRAGAAEAELRRARARGAGAAEIAALEAKAAGRQARVAATAGQAAAADLKRPFPQAGVAQVFGRATGAVEAPPLTAAILTASGEVVARAVVQATGAFHLTAKGGFQGARVQVSDAKARVLWRSPPVDLPEGTVLTLEAVLAAPAPEPGPVPAGPQMPELVGQSEGVAQALLSRLGVAEVTVEERVVEGPPDLVIAQSPKAGTPLVAGTPVTLVVRRAGADGRIALPALTGRPVEEGRKILAELGLKMGIEMQDGPAPKGTILKQEPAAGTKVAPGSLVTLVVAAGAPDGDGALSDLIARMAADARARIHDFTPARLGRIFKGAGVSTLEEARALAEAAPKEISGRTGLVEGGETNAFRLSLRAALKAIG